MKNLFSLVAMVLILNSANAQLSNYSFGKGLHIYGKDSSFHIKFGFRFQNLFSNEWNVSGDDLGSIDGYEANFLVRRSRLKFDGYAFTKKLKYKMELGLTNRDISGGASSEFSNAARIILDAYIDWNFAGNFSLRVGQAKLPGNRERVISSANLQFVDRSRLNSRFNIDRDMGLMLSHHMTLGDNFIIKKYASISQGEGRNVTVGFDGGFDYTFKVELYPMGNFKSKGGYTGADLKREEKPKLAIAFAYDLNVNAKRERGQLGAYIKDANGDTYGKTMYSFFADLMYKHKGFSLMSEFAFKDALDGDYRVFDPADGYNLLGSYYTGMGLNIQAGYLFKSNYEIAYRLTSIRPTNGAVNENEYGIALSKYFVGHQLKVQMDINYRQKYIYGASTPNQGSDDKLYWRVQMDIHF